MQRVSWFLRISGLTMLALIVAIAGLTTGSADAQSATPAATTAATAAAKAPRAIELCYTTDQVSEVRVVHAVVGGPAVDIYMDGGKAPAVSGLAFGKGTDYMQVLAGTHQLKLTDAGNASKVVATGSVTIAGQNAYTLVASGSPVKLTNIVDNASDTAGKARLAVIHAVEGGPTVDVINTKDNSVVVGKVALDKSANADVAPDTYDLAVIKSGDTKHTSLLDLKGTKLDADTITTVVITGAVDKTGKVTTPLAAITLSSKSFAGYANPNPPPAPTNTPAPTATKVPTATKGPTSTPLPKPTNTPKPPTNTPAPTATKGTPPTAAPKPTNTPVPVGQSPASLGVALRSSRGGYFYLNGGKCVEVAGVTLAGGPGDVAGLKAGDLILGVDGVGIANAGDFQAIIASHVSGDKITITIQRDGKRQDVKATLGANPFLS